MHNAHFIAGNTHTHFLQEEHIATSLRRYLHEEEARMQTLAASLRQGGKHVAAITAAVDVYIQRNSK